MATLNVQELLKRFAATISKQPLGLVTHAPEPGAHPSHSIGNVLLKVSRDGGRPIYGWVFLDRRSAELGDYLIAQHHAVWCASRSTVGVDVTPFHEDPRHRPYSPRGGVLFLLDDAAQPKTMGPVVSPLASRFYPANDDPKLAAYLETLRAKDQADCQRKLYEVALTATHPADSDRPN